MARIALDKYYTPYDLAVNCVGLFLQHISCDEITECIEPAVGGGAFVRAMRDAGLDVAWAGDIMPEFDDEIVETVDFLEKQFDYMKGRAVITNPPFGHSNLLSKRFFDKSCEIADFVGMILPVGQLNNTTSFCQFDLVGSYDLGRVLYSGRLVHCCFNVYQRPVTGARKMKTVYEPEGWRCYSVRKQSGKETKKPCWTADVRIGAFGNGSCGCILDGDKTLCQELWFQFDDEHLKDLFMDFDWRAYAQSLPHSGALGLTLQKVIKKTGELGLPIRKKGDKRQERVPVSRVAKTQRKEPKISSFTPRVRVGSLVSAIPDCRTMYVEMWLRFDGDVNFNPAIRCTTLKSILTDIRVRAA